MQIYNFMNLRLTSNQAGQQWGRGLHAVRKAAIDTRGTPKEFQSPLQSHLPKLPITTCM